MNRFKRRRHPTPGGSALGAFPELDGGDTGSKRQAFGGSLDDLPLPDVLQMLQSLKKSGVLTLSRQGVGATFGLDHGLIVRCEPTPTSNPGKRLRLRRRVELTLLEALAAPGGTFAFAPAEPGPFDVEPVADDDTALSPLAVLLDVLRQVDERGRHGDPADPERPPMSDPDRDQTLWARILLLLTAASESAQRLRTRVRAVDLGRALARRSARLSGPVRSLLHQHPLAWFSAAAGLALAAAAFWGGTPEPAPAAVATAIEPVAQVDPAPQATPPATTPSPAQPSEPPGAKPASGRANQPPPAERRPTAEPRPAPSYEAPSRERLNDALRRLKRSAADR